MARETLNIMSDVFRKWLQEVAEQLQCCCCVLQNIQRGRSNMVSQDGDDGGMYYILQILQRFYQFYTQILIL